MNARAPFQLTVYAEVQCLECGHAYAKPAGGGTSASNPGCPRCGYVGWIPIRRHTVAGVGNARRRQAL
jgi:predicted  nucleic acid-binding Zn-ribbon protein